MNKTKAVLTLLAIALMTLGCSPEVGSKRWCEQMQEKPKGEWSMNDAGDFAKHCLISGGSEE